MSEERLQSAWRTWVAEGTPEAAMAYCVEVSRNDKAPAKANKLAEVPWASLPVSRHEDVEHVFGVTVDKYLPTEWEDTFVEDLHWLSASHFWFAAKASPALLRGVAKVFEHYDMKLLDGDEEQAENDAVTASSRGSNTARRLRQELDRVREEVDSLREKARRTEDAERIKAHYERENKNLLAQNGRLERFKREEREESGLRANYETLKKENERLTKIIQEMKK